MKDGSDTRVRLRGALIAALVCVVAAALLVQVNGNDAPTATGPSVPQWYAANRVHGHTRLQFNRYPMTAEHFTQTSREARALGAHVLVRHIKSSTETPAWLSESTSEAEQRERSAPLRELFAIAGKEGLHTIAYYWHISDAQSAEKHPDWVCRDAQGNPQMHRRGAYLDITGPHRNDVARALLQAAAAGAEGFYFDHRHLPAGPCLGTRLESAYREKYGKAPPRRRDSPDYLRWRQFRATEMAATFHFWGDQLHAQFPDTVTLISATSIPALTLPDMTTDLVSQAPAKTEFRKALTASLTGRVFEKNRDFAVPDKDIRLAAGWAVLRDASGGLPPHVWAPAFPDEAHALGFAASVVTHGGIANLDIADELLVGKPVPAGKTPEGALRAAFAFGDRVSPTLAGSRALRWAAVHFSEQSRDRRWPDTRKQWAEVLWPFIGAYGALLRQGVPVHVVNDRQLAAGQLDDYQVLVLTNPDELDAGQRAAVEAFARRGGTLIENSPKWQWHLKTSTAKAQADFLDRVRPLLKQAPIRLTGGPTGLHAVAYRKSAAGRNELLVALTPDFSWVQDVALRKQERRKGSPPSGVPAGVTLELRGVAAGAPENRLQAVEALSGEALKVTRAGDALQVTLPAFGLFALAVVSW